ncbi:dihydrofolate reductase [methane-oxidizing endosymbiont of Gigantopelta aegis]|uniref:dihydrofolate reductase n=1 Tax=methane-oxidizing endosymbiont of Gigantopelta aegis TaxID=2794938 RepID=UPI0018DD0B59|nr:dihydrofolate reductase [methane-oxidizing endosymbiont of Gigantopelta aegis]
MKISLIVAMAENRVIGLNNQMPWHLSADLKNFKKITMGSPIIMGRKTFEAIGRPLPGRTNIIVSRNPQYQAENCLLFPQLDIALNHCSQHDEVFIIGGATLYEQTLERAHRLYLTQIHQAFSGDTYFPEIDKQAWVELEKTTIHDDPAVDFSYSFICLEKKVADDFANQNVGC